MRSRILAAASALLALVAACASRPAVPDWQMNANDAAQRAQAAYLAGDARIEAQEFAKARSEVARTGRAELVARVELARCAGRAASLSVEPCSGFEALRADASPAELAYASYLAGRVQAPDVPSLPEQHRAVASALAAGRADNAALLAIADPLARLVAAGALFAAGRADAQTTALAVDTASAQGWRRPLLAWLNLQAQAARQAGDADGAARALRRIDLVQGPAR